MKNSSEVSTDPLSALPELFLRMHMKKKPDLMVVLLIIFGAGLLISSVAQSGLL